jgi:uncharacterized phage protein gp47/JayE
VEAGYGMTFIIPTLPQLVDRARKAFRSNLPGSDAWLWPNNLNPTAKVIGGAVSENFAFIDHIGRQKFAHTADENGLLEHAKEYGIPRKPASPASGFVTVQASTPCVVNAEAVLQRGDGVQYVVTASGAGDAGSNFHVPVIALSDGKATIAMAGTPLTIVSGVSGAADVTAGPGGITGGSDVENIESWRERILFRKRNPPHGGAPSDYVLWAGEVPGVTRVFVERLYAGPGTVRVFPLMDGNGANGLPSSADISIIADHIATLSPSGALVSVAAPAALPIPIKIQDLEPNTTTVQEAVLAEIREAFLRLGRVAGNDAPHAGMPYLATPYSFSLSWIWQAVANATGETRHRIILPAADVIVPTGQIPVPGTVTFS